MAILRRDFRLKARSKTAPQAWAGLPSRSSPFFSPGKALQLANLKLPVDTTFFQGYTSLNSINRPKQTIEVEIKIIVHVKRAVVAESTAERR